MRVNGRDPLLDDGDRVTLVARLAMRIWSGNGLHTFNRSRHITLKSTVAQYDATGI